MNFRLMTRALGALTLLSCGDSGGDGGKADETGHLVSFHAEQTPFQGFGYDTGLQPEGSPVQVRFNLAANGTLSVDAQAVATGGADNPQANGVPGSGSFALAGAFTVQATLKVDVGLIQFDGPLMGVPDINIAIQDTQPFDPFLVGGPTSKVSLTAEIPQTEVAAIPLQPAAGIPGTLRISASGRITSDFNGRCAGATGDGVEYLGQTLTGGTLVLSATVEVEVPITGVESFGPFVLPEIPIGPFDNPLDFGKQMLGEVAPVATGPSAQSGTCVASTETDAGAGGAVVGGSGGGGGGGGTGGVEPPVGGTAGRDGTVGDNDASGGGGGGGGALGGEGGGGGGGADGGPPPAPDPTLIGQSCDECPGNPCFGREEPGVCSYECTADAQACGDSAGCVDAGGDMSYCFPGCVPQLGNNECAGPGTACTVLGVCLPACTLDADCNAEGEPVTSYCNLDLGDCLSVGSPQARIGDPCNDSADCPRNGLCLTSFPGGKCSLLGCELGGAFSCPQDFACVGASEGVVPNSVLYLCLPICGEGMECGAGEECIEDGTGLSVCSPAQ